MGNMYNFVDDTANPLSGKCSNQCSYCYVNKLKKIYPAINKKYSGALGINLKGIKKLKGYNKYIFVCSMNDLFADNVPSEMISMVFDSCNDHNRYLFQTKNPIRIYEFSGRLRNNLEFCITIETNRYYEDVMGNCKTPYRRFNDLEIINKHTPDSPIITIEPIMDFDLDVFVELLKSANPKQINIGADSGHNNLPEPTKEKTLALISELENFTVVHLKKNLNRILAPPKTALCRHKQAVNL